MRIHDVLTDLVCEHVAINLAEHRDPLLDGSAAQEGGGGGRDASLQGEAHGGMFEAAKRFKAEVGAEMNAALLEHPGYSLVYARSHHSCQRHGKSTRCCCTWNAWHQYCRATAKRLLALPRCLVYFFLGN